MIPYIKKLASWIWEGKYLFIFIFIIGLTFQLDRINVGYKTVDNIRFFGLGLELLGTLTIVYSLKDRLFLFKGHGLSKFFGDYLKKFPLRPIPKEYNMKADATSYALSTGTARIIKKPKEDFEDVIRYFEEEIQYIHRRLADMTNDMRKEVGNLKTTVESTKSNLSKEISDTKELIKDSAVSNIWLETFGLACVFVGLILGTAPDIVEKII